MIKLWKSLTDFGQTVVFSVVLIIAAVLAIGWR